MLVSHGINYPDLCYQRGKSRCLSQDDQRQDEQEKTFIDTVLKSRRRHHGLKKRFALPALSILYGGCPTDPNGGDDADQ